MRKTPISKTISVAGLPVTDGKKAEKSEKEKGQVKNVFCY
jgi:hypothetical protein